MSYPANPQQQQALFNQMNPPAHQQHLAHAQAQAQYAQLQAQARGNPQLQQQLHAQQLRAMQQQQQQQQGVAPAPAPVAPLAQPAGVSARERDVGDGDDHYRTAKRRKPTDRSLPSSFKPSLPPSVHPGPSDLALAPSLDALDRLGDAYQRLQDIERKVDWTVARKAVEVQEKASGAVGRGEPFRRTLRIHVTATAHDQPWQLSPDELVKEGDKDAVPDSTTAETETKPDTASDDNKVKVPRVEVRVTGEILEDERYPFTSTPFTTFLHRLVVETPSRDPTVQPVGAQPLSWTRPSPHGPPGAAPPPPPPKLPAALESSHPLSGGPDAKLDLKLSLYVAHPAGDRYALHPELANVLDTAEADRVGVLEALWSYAKSRGLVEENSDASAAATAQQQPGGAQIKSGIKPDDRLRKFFGNVGLVQFHHLPEYLNRLLLPPPPRQFVVTVPVTADASAEPQHFAFDTPIYVPSPVQPALDSTSRALSSLVNPAAAAAAAAAGSPTGTTSSSAAVLAAELSALDDKLAVNALAARQHAQQLHALQGFARDPRGFLELWVDSQAGALADVLAATSTGSARSAGALAGGSDGVLGPRWRDEIRKAESWDAPWVNEAVEVWALRDSEGKAQRARQAQAQAQVLQQQQAYVQQQQQAQLHAGAAVGYGRR
ncbi:hypothetical protein JCM9279_001815 [Rhodotorula babjevae]